MKPELRQLLKAWLAISVAFAISMSSRSWPGMLYTFPLSFGISLFTVGLGFVVHELSHKLMSHYFGIASEFRANDQMLLFAVLLSFTGIVFAAPGAVHISGYLNKKRNGIIALAGPLANIVVALIFLLLYGHAGGLLDVLARYGFRINLWLGFFNLLPFGVLDGSKVFAWNKITYSVMLLFTFLLVWFVRL